jgi:hypothetical protein
MDAGAVLPVVKKMALCITAIPAMEKVRTRATAARARPLSSRRSSYATCARLSIQWG